MRTDGQMRGRKKMEFEYRNASSDEKRFLREEARAIYERNAGIVLDGYGPIDAVISFFRYRLYQKRDLRRIEKAKINVADIILVDRMKKKRDEEYKYYLVVMNLNSIMEELLKFEVNKEQYDAFEKEKRAYVAWWPDSKRYEVILKSFDEWQEEKAVEKMEMEKIEIENSLVDEKDM